MADPVRLKEGGVGRRDTLYPVCILLLCATQLHWLSSHDRLFDIGAVFFRVSGAVVVGLGLAIALEKTVLRVSSTAREIVKSRIIRENVIGFVVIVTVSSAVYSSQAFTTVAILLGYLLRTIRPLEDCGIPGSTGSLTTRFDRGVSWLIFFGAILAVYLRAPELFHSPRFWAEDGKFFFSHFYNHREWYELLRAWEYYRFLHNITAYSTVRLLPLEHAPLAFTVVSGLVALAPAAVIVFGHSLYWNTPFKKVLLVALYLLVPFSQETWLNLNGTAYTLTLVSALILLSETTRKNEVSYRLLLLFAGLTGVLSCLLFPLFGIRAWVTREREHIVQFLLLLSCAVLQLTVVLYTDFIHRDGTHLRITPPSLETMILVAWLRTLVTVISVDWAVIFSGLFSSAIARPSQYSTYAVIYGATLLGVLWCLVKYAREFNLLLLAGCFLLLTGFSIFFGIGGAGNLAFLHPTNGMRYFYIPVVMLGFLLVSPLLRPRNNSSKTWMRWFSVGVATLMIHNGIQGYQYINVYEPDWPQWREEVEKWRNDQAYRPKIWPRRWEIVLKTPNNPSVGP